MPKITFQVTYEPVYGSSAPFNEKILKAMREARDNLVQEKIELKKYKRLVSLYPDIPQFYNYLVTAYRMKGQDKKAFKKNDELLQRFPDYLFAKIIKAEEYIETGTLDKVKFILGNALDLQALYPERQIFHIDEVMSYYKVVVDYLCELGETDKAEEYLELMIDVEPGHPACEYAGEKIMVKRMEINMARLQEERKNARSVEPDSYDALIQTDEPPTFRFPEIWQLYENSIESIETATLQQILLLPPDELIVDLETVLLDSIRRFEFFKNQYKHENVNVEQIEFPIHALFLLAELQAESSLPRVLDFLRQGQQFLDFWLADLLTEAVWEVIYKLGQHQLPVLEAFMCERNRYTFAIAPVSSAVFEMALHQPDRRQEVIGVYRRVLEHFLENLNDDSLIDSDTIGSVISDVTELRATELLPQIERLFEHKVVWSFICGTLPSVQRDIQRPIESYQKQDILSIFERYDYIRQQFGSPDDEYEDMDETDWEELSHQPVRVGEKVGRNDPCPCGSGKKYKKCCWEKDQSH